MCLIPGAPLFPVFRPISWHTYSDVVNIHNNNRLWDSNEQQLSCHHSLRVAKHQVTESAHHHERVVERTWRKGQSDGGA